MDDIGFMKVRRSLLLVSLVLALVVRGLVDAGPDQTVGGFGFEVKVSVAHYALWAMWAYFLLLYVQHFRTARESAFVGTAWPATVDAWRKALEVSICRRARALRERAYKREPGEEPPMKIRFRTSARLLSVEPNGAMRLATALEVQHYRKGRRISEHGRGEQEHVIGGLDLLARKLIAGCEVALLTPIGLHFYLPFVVAAAPVIAAVT